MALNPDATYDCLFMANRLQREAGKFTAPELHLFGYLACLLWLYRRRAITDWGYSFVGTELGAPFSLDLDSAIKALVQRGYFLRATDHLNMTDAAHNQLRDFSGLTMNQSREECLNAACSSTTAFSSGMVCNALAQEPDLRRARLTPMGRPLLEDAARSQLYVQFDALRSALHQTDGDLRLPAVVWLTALYRARELTT
jgi:hypothetical protein